MGEKLVVGPINRGLKNNRTAFVIDNDSFPTLLNAYQWRGRVKRKRGTSKLTRLARFFNSLSTAYIPAANSTLNLVAGSANILTGFSLQTNGNIIPGTVIIHNQTVAQTYTDPAMDGTLTGNIGGTGTINYATGDITILAGSTNTIDVSFIYYPDLPVMGIEDLTLNPTQYPLNLCFDTVYSYNLTTTTICTNYDVSFYKNPPTGLYSGYVQKTTWTPTTWNGLDYQQTWSTNYQGALWVTNGVKVPYIATNIGMQYSPAADIVFSARTATTITLVIQNCPLVIGDFVFFNEWTGGTAAQNQTLNFQTGYVTACNPNTPPLTAKTVTITLPNAALSNIVFVPGIIQYLTTRRDTTIDCLRFYTGDPTNASVTAPTFVAGQGWVNFAPPISEDINSIGDLPAAKYYLVGAKMIVPFKDRLLFIGVVVQASGGTPIYLQDTIVYSQNGTPYYTASFTGDPVAATTVFNPILVPDNQIATAPAYFADQTGFGGFITAGIDQPIITTVSNRDVLIIGFSFSQSQLVYTGDDITPFNFYQINSELGSGSTFSSINMDSGVISRGNRGFIITNQSSTQRFDLDIPDEVFEISLSNNGAERVCAQRDYIHEWIYFSYLVNSDSTNIYKFPNQSLFYNYRDQSWAIFKESYTTYGQRRISDQLTWATVGAKYPTWADWNDPWNAGDSTTLQNQIIAGNQQGYIIERDDGTGEEASLYIRSISGNLITSPDHGLNENDYIIIQGCIGPVGVIVNNNIYSVYEITQNTFRINPSVATANYFGGGEIVRMYIPLIQTKQFPVAWNMSRKTRIGVQQYLLTTTSNGQIELQIYLSQNAVNAYNLGTIVPSSQMSTPPENPPNNNSLIYSTILYTCTESANLGLTAANTNLQMISLINASGTNASSPQSQIWHRVNTSLIGDTIQLGFTMSDTQMRDVNFNNQFSEIELHGINMDVSPSMVLA